MENIDQRDATFVIQYILQYFICTDGYSKNVKKGCK